MRPILAALVSAAVVVFVDCESAGALPLDATTIKKAAPSGVLLVRPPGSFGGDARTVRQQNAKPKKPN